MLRLPFDNQKVKENYAIFNVNNYVIIIFIEWNFPECRF